MRVAVTYDNGNIFGHFGRTEQFKVYDIEDGRVVNSQILGTDGGAVNAIEEAGIKLYAGASGSADAAVEALIAGTLEAIGEANCDHHDHEHGEGHSCSHGKCHE